MKLLFTLSLLVFFSVGTAQIEAKTDIVDEIAEMIRDAKVKELSALFDMTVELTIQERENAYSKAQAEIILKTFFSKHPPKSFKVMHRGASERGGRYLIGLMESENGSSFRTSVVIIEKNDQYVIQQLRFE
ncbi:MAG: DUF4783 domain-containing protein [Bacteroidia bacterium]